MVWKYMARVRKYASWSSFSLGLSWGYWSVSSDELASTDSETMFSVF
jgi:hypothetical protein